MSTIIGIDISQDSSSFHLLSEVETREISGLFAMNRSNIQSLLQRVSHVLSSRFFIESTGCYHLTLARSLLQRGHRADIVNPVLVKQFGNASLLKYLYLMASGINWWKTYFKTFYNKKRQQGFLHRKMVFVQMNQITKILFAMFKKKRMFGVPT